ncbi:MAG: dihydroorotate dehydrogenase [Candidatus Cloacimonadaceae bacterium]|nr:dihydroorotate dehydrogenase [Candidatus Cloacimonadaceae bacterium]MDP3113715.1 dihydroorotate dehydrogenase [Candidatus Cloacimonadaceae bacterium]
MNRLKTRLGKLHFESPVTVASGTFGTEYFDFFDQRILGAYVSKTITYEPKAGNPPPRLYETEAGLINSIGLQNPGIDVFIKSSLPELREKLYIPLVVSFSGSSITEFCAMLEMLEISEGIDGYEVNVSCPNVENEGIAFGTDPDTVFELTQKLSAITNKELIIKLSPNVSDIATIAIAAEAGGASSLALINTLFGMAIDIETGKSRIKKGVGGYSGTGIKPVALALTYKAARAVKIPILAMGGIYTWQDALEFFYAGASMIALGTANFINPIAAAEAHHGLDVYLAQRDLRLKDIVGKVNG